MFGMFNVDSPELRDFGHTGQFGSFDADEGLIETWNSWQRDGQYLPVALFHQLTVAWGGRGLKGICVCVRSTPQAVFPGFPPGL